MTQAATPPSQLPLGSALRRYWPYLLGYVLYAAAVVTWPGLRGQPWLDTMVWLAVALVAALPSLIRAAPISFLIAGYLLWFVLAAAIDVHRGI
jgi:hypothetical protein